MNKNIEDRVLQESLYILETKGTVRSVSKYFGLSKSTIHYDLSKRLKLIDLKLFGEIKLLFQLNFKEKNIRGGKATKAYYLTKKNRKKHIK